MKDPATRLAAGAAALGVTLDDAATAKLTRLAAELARWNKAYNLTAITAPEEVLTHHLLDSLAALPDLAGTTVADVGTGAGFPGLPLAIADPARQFTLIDSVDKKLRFIDHMARELDLPNVTTRHARVEQLKPEKPFDTVIARAFAPLPRLVALVAPLAGPATRVVAMKGRWPPPPGDEGDGGPLPAGWRIEAIRRVEVPGLPEERHQLLLRYDPPPVPPG